MLSLDYCRVHSSLVRISLGFSSLLELSFKRKGLKWTKWKWFVVYFCKMETWNTLWTVISNGLIKHVLSSEPQNILHCPPPLGIPYRRNYSIYFVLFASFVTWCNNLSLVLAYIVHFISLHIAVSLTILKYVCSREVSTLL